MSSHGTQAWRERKKYGMTSLQFEYLPAEELLKRLEAQQRIARLPLYVEKAMWRARHSGRFTVSSADDICVHVLGVHPLDVFGPLWFEDVSA